MTPPSPAVAADVEQNFRIVTRVLGLDSDQVLKKLMAGWLDGLKTKVRMEAA